MTKGLKCINYLLNKLIWCSDQMRENSQSPLVVEAYAKFGIGRLRVMELAENWLSPLTIQNAPYMAEAVDTAVVVFSNKQAEMKKIKETPIVNLSALAVMNLLPSNVAFKIRSREGFNKRTSVLFKRCNDLTLQDIESLPFEAEDKIRVTASVIAARILRTAHEAPSPYTSRQKNFDPREIGERRLLSGGTPSLTASS